MDLGTRGILSLGKIQRKIADASNVVENLALIPVGGNCSRIPICINP